MLSSLKYAIYFQIATNDHFGRNAFEMLNRREKIEGTTTMKKMVNANVNFDCNESMCIVQRWKQKCIRNTLHVRTKYTCMLICKRMSTSTSIEHNWNRNVYEKAFLLVCLYNSFYSTRYKYMYLSIAHSIGRVWISLFWRWIIYWNRTEHVH